MRKIVIAAMIALMTAVLTACATTPTGPVRTKSALAIPELNENTYKTVDTSRKTAGLYFYSSKLGPAHVEDADMTLRVMKDVMDEKVSFYKIDVSDFSPGEQRKLLNEVIGEKSLPAYVFIYENRVMAKKIGSYTSRDSAIDGARILYDGFRDKVWSPGPKRKK